MGVITALFLYSLPYLLAASAGFLFASFRSEKSKPPSLNRKIRKRVEAQEAVGQSEEGGESEALKQAKLEVCDRDLEDSDVGGRSEDGAFNFSEGHHVPFKVTRRFSVEEMILRSRQFYQEMNTRRSVRFFTDEPVPLEVIGNIIRTAGTAPSGAHTEPWMYSVIRNKGLKNEIREIIEEEERINYEKRMGPKWVNDLKHIGTTYRKPYLSRCSTIIVVFKQVFSYDENGQRKTHYYHELSTAISVGLLLAAIQNAGLVTCTTTPMNAGPRLRSLLGRQSYEKVILLLPVGYPADNVTVPDLHRKPLEDIMDLHEEE